jgi:predicted RNA-binding protein YlqC (UPF0109 family)
MKDLIDYIARSLVDDASAVQVAESRDRSTRMKVYRLTVAPGETGRVIGKEGKIANAIRVLLRAASAKSGEHITLKIM